MKVKLNVNGRQREADVEPRKTLLDTLREDFLLVGSHAGCADQTARGHRR